MRGRAVGGHSSVWQKIVSVCLREVGPIEIESRKADSDWVIAAQCQPKGW